MLVLGLGTRFAALGLLIMTATIQLFVMPEALWSAHIYWAAILLVLMSRGPGPISFDALIRYLARR
jgi:putative oxidoreductase